MVEENEGGDSLWTGLSDGGVRETRFLIPSRTMGAGGVMQAGLLLELGLSLCEEGGPQGVGTVIWSLLTRSLRGGPSARFTEGPISVGKSTSTAALTVP